MTWPKLSNQQKKDLARFLRYLRELDAKDLLTEYGTVSYNHTCRKLYDIFHVAPITTKSNLTYQTGESFALNLAESIRATVKSSIEDKTDKYYDAHVVEQCGNWLRGSHIISSFND